MIEYIINLSTVTKKLVILYSDSAAQSLQLQDQSADRLLSAGTPTIPSLHITGPPVVPRLALNLSEKNSSVKDMDAAPMLTIQPPSPQKSPCQPTFTPKVS